MREYELIIDKALKNGLKPITSVPFNTQTLLECLGFRCGRAGLEVHETLSNNIPNTIPMHYSWPFPQFICGELYNILIVRDSITNQEDIVYAISSDYSTIEHIFSIDELTFGKGTLMEIADFGEYLFMTNGVVMIYWDPNLSAWQVITSSPTIPMMRTICNFKGQAIGGNIVSAWHGCDETFYIWSKIGSMDFTPDLENDAGYRRCPFGGVVKNVKRIGNNVVGYSSKGITLISPVNSPASTFGFTELDNIGIINQGAVNGDYHRHVYVGEDYILREVSIQGELSKIYGVKELGYQHYMEELQGEDIIINYDPHNKDFYIGNSIKTFLLSPYGLSEVMQHPSAVWRLDNKSSMIPDTIDITKPVICTEIFDMGYRGQKTISTIETDSILGLNIEAGSDWAYDLINWGLEFYKPLNNMGIATVPITGGMFRFRMRFGTLYETGRLSYIKVRYKMTDLRGIRGVYAPKIRGQEGE